MWGDWWYILDDAGNPVPEPDPIAWMRWIVELGPDRQIARTRVGEVWVSTVFLGLNIGTPGGAPILWETMTFGPEPWNGEIWPYASRAEADRGHAEVCTLIGLDQNLTGR